MSMIGFNITSHRLRKVNLSRIPFYRYNYGSDGFFSRSLILANKVMNYVDFFFISRIVFNRNVYLAISSIAN